MDILLELVFNNLLVINGASKRPYMVFFEAVVNVNEVWVDRVGVKVLSLYVIPVEDFVVVVHWDDCSGAYDVLFLGDEGLKSFEGVNLVHRDIIPVMVLMRIVMDRLVHATEWLVDVRMIELTREQVVDRNGNSLVSHNVLACVLVLRGKVVNSCSEALSETVFMDSPHQINFFSHLLIGKLASHKGRAKSPQRDAPRIKLEHRYKLLKNSRLTGSEREARQFVEAKCSKANKHSFLKRTSAQVLNFLRRSVDQVLVGIVGNESIELIIDLLRVVTLQKGASLGKESLLITTKRRHLQLLL